MPNVEMPESHRTAFSNPALLTDFKLKERRYVAMHPVGHGFLGFVWKVKDDLGRSRAAKFTTYQDFEEKSYIPELQLASRLEEYRNFVRTHDAGVVELDLPERTPFMCFIEDWVEGQTLQSFLDKLPANQTFILPS